MDDLKVRGQGRDEASHPLTFEALAVEDAGKLFGSGHATQEDSGLATKSLGILEEVVNHTRFSRPPAKAERDMPATPARSSTVQRQETRSCIARRAMAICGTIAPDSDVITGSLGHLGMPLTKELEQRGHALSVVSHREERRKEIEVLGAAASIGLAEDAQFLISAFIGADAASLMLPPDYAVSDHHFAKEFAAVFSKS
ncbi:MAG: hypothetical protein ACLQMF_07020 [Rectinemataceae bacterium]